MAKVIAPNQQYSGLSAGVMFVNGIGETDNEHLLQWFEEKGYTVVYPEVENVSENMNQQSDTPDDPNQQQPDTQIEKMSVAQLKEYAAANEIDLGEAAKKEEILAAIQNAQQIVE